MELSECLTQRHSRRDGYLSEKVPQEYDVVCLLPAGMAKDSSAKPIKNLFEKRVFFKGFWRGLRMKKRIICIFAALHLFSSSLSIRSFADDIENLWPEAGNTFSCLYGETERRFSVYLPAGEMKGLVFMLHGYGSDMNAFRLLTGMDSPANERGYTVIYVNGVHDPGDASYATGWNSGIGKSSVDDMGFLNALAHRMQAEYGLTKNETFAAGFSNGGFMMYRIAAEGQEFFGGVASVSGMMPAAMWNEKGEKADISVLQINGTKDDAVPMNCNGTAKYSKAPAIEDVIDYFAAAGGLDEEETVLLSSRAQLTKHTGADSAMEVWQVLIKDGRHSWPEEEYVGFDTCSVILDFFDAIIPH